MHQPKATSPRMLATKCSSAAGSYAFAGNAPLVDAIIAMAKSLGLKTVAEGVETEAQWHYLKSRHAHQVQGFLFCRPLKLEDLERWHSEWLHSHQHSAANVG